MINAEIDLPEAIKNFYELCGEKFNRIKLISNRLSTCKVYKDSKVDVWQKFKDDPWQLKYVDDLIVPERNKLIVADFYYHNAKDDSRPKVVIFTVYKDRNGEYLAGLNLNYMNQIEKDALKTFLMEIMSDFPEDRYAKIKSICNWAIKSYRKYDQAYIANVKSTEIFPS